MCMCILANGVLSGGGGVYSVFLGHCVVSTLIRVRARCYRDKTQQYSGHIHFQPHITDQTDHWSLRQTGPEIPQASSYPHNLEIHLPQPVSKQHPAYLQKGAARSTTTATSPPPCTHRGCAPIALGEDVVPSPQWCIGQRPVPIRIGYSSKAAWSRIPEGDLEAREEISVCP